MYLDSLNRITNINFKYYQLVVWIINNDGSVSKIKYVKMGSFHEVVNEPIMCKVNIFTSRVT